MPASSVNFFGREINPAKLLQALSDFLISHYSEREKKMMEDFRIFVGAMYADVCINLDSGKDYREMQFPEIIRRLEKATGFSELTGGE